MKYSQLYFGKYFTLTDMAKHAHFQDACQKCTNCVLITIFLFFIRQICVIIELRMLNKSHAFFTNICLLPMVLFYHL